MNKIIAKMIIKLLSDNIKYPIWELTQIMDTFFVVITELLEQEESVRITNFGKFAIKRKKAHRYYNLRTGKIDYKSDTKKLVFTPHKNLGKKINAK